MTSTPLRQLVPTTLIAVVLGLSTACAPATSSNPGGATATAAVTEPAPSGRQPSAEDLRVPRALVDALNRGDSTAAAALFTPTARFDSVGRIYPDRQAIFDRFLDPEVIAAGGRYVERSARLDGDRVVVEYDFTTRSGGRERFTYAYLVRDGLITDVVGRYV